MPGIGYMGSGTGFANGEINCAFAEVDRQNNSSIIIRPEKNLAKIL